MDRNSGQYFLTPDGYEKLHAELQELEALYAENNAEFKASKYGNQPSKEEAAYLETRATREHDQDRIGRLRLILQNAVFVDNDPAVADVNPGKRVTVWDYRENHEIYFDLLGPEEMTAGRSGVTIASHVGKALLGRTVGDTVEAQVPDGKVKYEIRRIERIPQDKSDSTEQVAATR